MRAWLGVTVRVRVQVRLIMSFRIFSSSIKFNFQILSVTFDKIVRILKNDSMIISPNF